MSARRRVVGSLLNPFDVLGLLMGRDEQVAQDQRRREQQDREERRLNEKDRARLRKEKNRARRTQYTAEIKALRAKAKQCPACRGRKARGRVVVLPSADRPGRAAGAFREGGVAVTARAERRMWAQAASLADLGALTVDWLEGRIARQPGYGGPVDVDEVDAPGLTAALIAANRGGYVTTDSQAGYDGRGISGALWQQLAWVSGYATPQTAERLSSAAQAADAGIVVICWRRGDWDLPVTWRNGQPVTSDGWRTRRVIRQEIYPGISRAARRQVYAARRVSIVHQTPGDNTLWTWLAHALPPAPVLRLTPRPPITRAWPGRSPAGDRPVRTGAGLVVPVQRCRGGESA